MIHVFIYCPDPARLSLALFVCASRARDVFACVCVVPLEDQQQRTEQHQWSAVVFCPEGQAMGLSEAHQANQSGSCPLCAQAEGTWVETHTSLRQQCQRLRGCFKTQPQLLTYKNRCQVFVLLHTCKRRQHPEVQVGGLVVLLVLVLSSPASPETNSFRGKQCE